MSAESQHKRYKAVGALLAGATLWSLGGLLVKQIDWNPVAIAGMRSAIAALIIMPFVRRARITWSPAQLGGAVAYAGTVTLFVVANKLTTAANTILLQYTAPIYVALFSAWFLREKASPLDWITTVVVLGGISLFFLDELTVQGSWGNVCAILAGVCFGWMFLFLRKQKTESPLESVFLGNVLAAVVCCPLMFRSMPDGRSWMTLVLLGTVQLGLPYILVVWAIRRVALHPGRMGDQTCEGDRNGPDRRDRTYSKSDMGVAGNRRTAGPVGRGGRCNSPGIRHGPFRRRSFSKRTDSRLKYAWQSGLQPHGNLHPQIVFPIQSQRQRLHCYARFLQPLADAKCDGTDSGYCPMISRNFFRPSFPVSSLARLPLADSPGIARATNNWDAALTHHRCHPECNKGSELCK